MGAGKAGDTFCKVVSTRLICFEAGWHSSTKRGACGRGPAPPVCKHNAHTIGLLCFEASLHVLNSRGREGGGGGAAPPFANAMLA